jgi:hypothetical protein
VTEFTFADIFLQLHSVHHSPFPLFASILSEARFIDDFNISESCWDFFLERRKLTTLVDIDYLPAQ